MKPQPPVTRIASPMLKDLLVTYHTILESILPRTHSIQMLQLQAAIRQCREGGTPSCCRIIDRGDGDDRHSAAAETDNLRGKLIPAGLSRVHAVVRPGTAVLDRCPELMYDVLGEGGTADLVIHDAQLVLLTGQSQDGADEVVPCAAVQPGKAQDEMVRVGLPGRLLALQFCPAVDGEGTRGGLLVVWLGRRAVEDIVGGEVDDASTDTPGGLRNVAGTQDVDTVRRILFGLSPVHCGVGCTVDHDLGAGGLYSLPQGGTVGDVQLVHDAGGHIHGGGQGTDAATARWTYSTATKKPQPP